ncbi:hypothetical protein TRFO_02554 [Tritrichomonas foetus]|uniref:Uncharacterized protein n=1 Tax=Tritrichomonas foetus TaxID=1144522 RepID=A0A1J4L359_9EUKA|nr:hypothetical protein TRFO_02554 [Tritrichomonas foetus]|eukprot:OHT17512.1 hypothetical protein TRFO_02554 [Tritrichomonas foetus]
MRLNRENTLIENNLYPCAGFHPKDVQAKFVKALEPFKTDILNIESALLLHNIPLFSALAGFCLVFLIFSNCLVKSFVPSLAYGIILVPLFHLFYCLGGVEFGRKLYKDLPELGAEDPLRIRPLEEIVSWFWFPILWGWRIGFYIYRTFVCPNIIDTSALIIITIILGCILRAINIFYLLIFVLTLAFAAPAVLTRTPAGDVVKQFLQDLKEKHAKKE